MTTSIDIIKSLKTAYTTICTCVLALIFLCLTTSNVIAQEFHLGIPSVNNYPKSSYKASAQNWEVISALDHIIFANNAGLLSYDGHQWQIHGMNNSIMRSLCYDGDQRIYCGGQNEIGYFAPKADGKLVYTSLRDSLNINENNLSEIWDIDFHQDTLWFTSENNILYHTEGQTKKINLNNLASLFRVGGKLIINEDQKGIYQLINSELISIDDQGIFVGKHIIEILENADGHRHYITEHNGIYKDSGTGIHKVKTNIDQFLREKIVCSATLKNNKTLLIGTRLGGLISLDEKYNCNLKLDKTSGLNNNSINCLKALPSGDVWIGANNGIDQVNLNANFRFFYPDGELEGPIYDVEKWQGNIYFSSSNGLYYISEQAYYNPIEERKFSLVEGTTGQNWGLDLINNKLYCAHGDGPKQINRDNKTEAIPSSSGAWKFIALSDTKVALGHYQGVNIYSVQDGKLVFDYKVPSLSVSSRILCLDHIGNLWVSHPYDYVYKISFSDNYSNASVIQYDATKGFKTNDKNYVFGINGTCYLTNESGAYIYNSETDYFDEANVINNYFQGSNHVRSLIEFEEDIWCITDQSTTLLKHEEKGLSRHYEKIEFQDIKAVDNYIGGFENLYCYDNNTIFLCSDQGIIEYNLTAHEAKDIKARICKIQLKTNKDSLLYNGFGSVPKINLEPTMNSIQIDFGTNKIGADSKIEYAFKLDDLDTYWSAWSSSSIKEYNHLPHGEYTFILKARTSTGSVSEPLEFQFSIRTPWYKTTLAYVLYYFLFCLALFSIFFFQRRSFKTEKAVLESEVFKSEEEMEKIKKEKLEEQIRFKNKELAMTTMNLLQKEETLNAIRQEVQKAGNKIKDSQAKKEIKKIINHLNSNERFEGDWDNFSLHFDQVHHDFLKRLTDQFPALTPKDQKLCAYLRMNLSTKEIAPLLKISVRGVEISRYRLRKKIELDKEINLNAFMMQF